MTRQQHTQGDSPQQQQADGTIREPKAPGATTKAGPDGWKSVPDTWRNRFRGDSQADDTD